MDRHFRIWRPVLFVALINSVFVPLLSAAEPMPPASRLYHPEELQDPYAPGEGQRPDGLRSIPRTPAGSVQVNVNGSGMNIGGDAANEPSITVDPTNPQRMAIGWRQFDTTSSNFRQAGNAYTTDGGAHWTFPGVLDPGQFRSDPCLAADLTGRFFYESLKDTFCMDVFQSTNGGATYPTRVAAFGGDKNWMAVDNTGGVGNGFLYTAWQSAAICSGSGLFTRSTNSGNTWMSPISVTNSPRFGVVAVGPDGAVYVTGTTSSLSTFVVAKSTNAQNSGVMPTWTFSVTGNFLGGAQVIQTSSLNPAGLMGQVWLAVNPSNATHVYLLCSVDPTGSDPLDVRFARSINGGQAWGASVRVNDDSTSNGASQWFGTMSVAPNGRIDVIWNDTRDDVNNQLSRLYYSYSLDEGTTWAPNVGLTPQWDSHLGWPAQNKIGDYYHMVSDNDGASLAYAATFNGEQDVYFMRICAAAPTAPTSATSDRSGFCADDSGNIALTAVGGSGGTIHWYDQGCGTHEIGTGSPLTIPSPTVTTTYYTRREAAPCASSACASVTVTVNTNPRAPTSPMASPPTICAGQSSSLSATVDPGQTAEWFTSACGGASVPGGANPTVNAASSTTYFVRAKDPGTNCTSTTCASVTLNVNPLPAAPTGPTATPPAICVGQSSTLSATVGGGQTIDWFTDSCGGTAVPGGANPSVSPIVGTTYYARARDTGTGCVSSGCVAVSVFLADHTGDFDGAGVGESDLQPFVDTLLNKGTPRDCIADMNNDGAVDGLDITLWVAAFLGP